MPIEFNATALNVFRNAQFQDENTVANLDSKGLKSGGTFHGGNIFRRIGRSSEEKRANNEVRTVLLKSLGQAFGISGMEEKNGKVTFSKDFMVNLKKILGDDVLKSSDFELNNDGSVTSGRPLTQRRITAIMKKADIVGCGEFNVHDYEAKLAIIKKDLGKLDTKSGFNTAFINYFNFVEKSLNFLKNDMDNLVVENEEWIANNDIGDDNTGIPRYLINYKLPKSGLKPSLWGKADMREFLGTHMVNGVFHTEQYSNIPVLINTPAAMKALTDYIRTTVTNFVQGAIDLYLDAKDAGKVQQLIEKWNEAPAACMDAKAEEPNKLREELGLMTDAQLDVRYATEHTSTTKLDKCIYEEIDVAIKKRNAKKMPAAKGWNDIKDDVKKALVGEKRPIMTLDINDNIVPLKENGEQVVREVTAEDIDNIGPACCDVLRIFW